MKEGEIDVRLDNIYNIDCLEGLKYLGNDSVDICITSPPYNVGKALGVGGVDMYDGFSDNMDENRYYAFISETITQLLRVVRHHVFFNFQKLSNNRNAYNKIIWEFRNRIKEEFIWAKTNPPAAIHPHVVSAGFEYIICFSNEDCSVRNFKYCNFNNRVKTAGKSGQDMVKSCIISQSNYDNRHPGIHACFPSWLPDYFIKYFSKKGDIVLDPFMGSGTTAVAAKKFERHFIGFEIDKSRCDYAMERVKKMPERWF